MTRFMTRVVAGIGALALAGTMTACSRPSTAAVVGGERISVAEVTELTEGLPDALQAQPGAPLESLVLNLRMRSVAAEQIAEEHGVTDLVAQAEAAVAQLDMPEELANDPEFRTLLLSEAETLVLREHMGTQEVERALAAVPVTVNPRYGLTGLEPFDTVRNSSLSKRAGQPE